MRGIPRSKLGWYGSHVKAKNKACNLRADVVIVGDSIVHHLQRYPSAWEKIHHMHSDSHDGEERKVINCGSRGDRIQNVLYRVEHMYLPDTTTVGIIQCGINDIRGGCDSNFSALKIAEGIILCGEKLEYHHPRMSIIIVGILPTAGSFPGEGLRISAVNAHLKSLCKEIQFIFKDA